MSGEHGAVSLELLARGQQQLVSEVRSLRDDMGVMMAILMRIDGTLSGMLNELRALHTQNARQDSRLRALEAAGRPQEGAP